MVLTTFLIWDSQPSLGSSGLAKRNIQPIIATIKRMPGTNTYLLTKNLPARFFGSIISTSSGQASSPQAPVYPVYTDASIAIDNATQFGFTSVGGIGQKTGITIPTATDFIVLQCWNQSTPTHTNSSPLFNGSAMTTVGESDNWDGTGNDSYLYTFQATTSGSNNLFQVTTSGSADGNKCQLLPYQGVSSTRPLDGAASSTATASTVSTTQTPNLANGEAMVSFINNNDGQGTITKNAGIDNVYDGYNNTVVKGGDSASTTQTVGNAFTQTWNTGFPNQHVVMFSLFLNPSASGGSNPPPASTIVQDDYYSYDPVGNITKISNNSTTDGKATTTYQYDALNRLTQASTTNATAGDYLKTYAYNWIGDITAGDLGTYAYAGTSTGNGNPHAFTSIGGVATSTYDSNGNMLTFKHGSNATSTYTWDYRNRIINSAVGGTTTVYAYDNGDERVLMSTSTGGTIFPFKFYSIATSTNATNTIIKQIYANGDLIATIKGSNATATPYYVHTDHLGGTDLVSNGSATIEQEFAYYPFGGMRVSKNLGGFSEARRFTGHEYDTGTTLNYMDARYEDGSTGRFLSEDPNFLTESQKVSHWFDQWTQQV